MLAQNQTRADTGVKRNLANTLAPPIAPSLKGGEENKYLERE